MISTPPSTDYTKPHPHLHVVVDGVGGSDDGAAGPLPTCKVDISNEKHHKLTSTSSG